MFADKGQRSPSGKKQWVPNTLTDEYRYDSDYISPVGLEISRLNTTISAVMEPDSESADDLSQLDAVASRQNTTPPAATVVVTDIHPPPRSPSTALEPEREEERQSQFLDAYFPISHDDATTYPPFRFPESYLQPSIPQPSALESSQSQPPLGDLTPSPLPAISQYPDVSLMSRQSLEAEVLHLRKTVQDLFNPTEFRDRMAPPVTESQSRRQSRSKRGQERRSQPASHPYRALDQDVQADGVNLHHEHDQQHQMTVANSYPGYFQVTSQAECRQAQRLHRTGTAEQRKGKNTIIVHGPLFFQSQKVLPLDLVRIYCIFIAYPI